MRTLKSSFSAVSMSALVIFIVLLSSMSFCYPTLVAATTSASLGTKFVRINILDPQGNYLPSKYYTATQLVALVTSIHQKVGSFNIVGVLQGAGNKGTPNPAETGFSDWKGTLDSFVTALQTASGGQLIAEGNLDIYFGANSTHSPPCPSCFFTDTASLLKFSAIANGQRYMMLGSWAPAFYAAENPTRTFIQHFFQNLTNQGWKGFIAQDSPMKGTKTFKAYDYGYAQYAKLALFFDPSSPSYFYVNEPYITSMTGKEPYVKGHILAEIAAQLLNQTSAIGQFLNLTSKQQVTSLKTLAANQAVGGYTFIYPVLVNQAPTYGGPVWDANRTLQPNGTSFLTLITNLMDKYNGGKAATTTLSTTVALVANYVSLGRTQDYIGTVRKLRSNL